MFKLKKAAMGRIDVKLKLANYEDLVLSKAKKFAKRSIRQVEVDGTVDTGASRLVLPKSIVDALGLTASGSTRVRYADNRTRVRPLVTNVWLELCGRSGIFTAIVEPNRKTALVGAIVLEDLDLIADCAIQAVYPRDPRGIVSEVE